MTRSRSAGLALLWLSALSGLVQLAVACDDADQPPPNGASPAAALPPLQPEAAAASAPAIAGAAALARGPTTDGEAASRQDPSLTAELPNQAQPEATTWLLGQLRDANAFRARATAAMALGRRKGARVEAGLIAALRDDHPAVRTAAASALSRFSGPAVEAALKQAKDREPDRTAGRALGRAEQTVAAKPALPTEAPSAVARGGVYVSLPRPRTQGALDAELLARADAAARAALRRLPGVRIAPAGESAQAAEAVLSAEGRTGYQLDVTLGLEAQPAGTRATANVLVASYPGRSIRGMTKGAATVSGDPRNAALQRTAIEHAVASAFGDLPKMFEAGR